MIFCPQCRSLMVSTGGQLKCRKCGHIKEIADEDQMKRTRKRKEREITIVDDKDHISVMPTTNARCPECGNDTAEWWLRQLRSADESEVRFFRCTKCKYTWREYD
ncbi:MAG: transcription factor S [Methanomicrobiaceae archaeon]|nr:transcription factor S [Methanomicrobiaceae archaeon]